MQDLLKTFLVNLVARCREFAAARDGNIAVIFTLTLIPVMGSVGAAVDYSRASSARTALQAATDSTALALAKTASNLTPSQLQSQAKTYFDAVFNRPEAQSLQVVATFNEGKGTSLKVAASATVKSNFMGLLGVSTMDIGATSVSAWGNVKLRVSLVLDNTGSMSSSGKMDALKRASHELLELLKDAAANRGDVQVAIVPFSKDVNIGKSNRDKSWIDWSEWDAANGSEECKGRKKRNCKTEWVPADRNTWNGCVTDRDKDDDTSNTTPTGSRAKFPAEQYDSCPAPVVALTDDFWVLGRAIDDMRPAGNTNQTIGLAWGWQALSAGAPLNPPPLDPDTSQAIILLTDGMNTQNRWSTRQRDVDDRMREACTNAKAAGITIYTVLVMAGNSSLLRECATDPSNHFALNSSNEIGGAFVQIGSELTQLRIAR